MPNERWNDTMLDERFASVDAQLQALRDLPARVATFDIRLTNVDEHLRSVALDLRGAAVKADEQTHELSEIKIEMAKIGTQVKVWATVGGVVGAGLVSAVIALLPHA